MDNSKILKVAIVGVGNMGSAHANNICSGKIEKMKLVALCDISYAKRVWASEKFGDIPVYADLDKMLDEMTPDVLIVAVPHYFHVECAIKALEKGINVMVEKPASVSVSDAEKMNRAADKSGKAFGIMFNQRTAPIFRKCRELVHSGEIGKIKRVSWCVTNWYRTQSYYNSSSWRASWGGEGGGVLINQAPHNIDMLQWIFGMPSSVRARCIEGKYHDIEVEDFAHIYMEYEDGMTADFLSTTGEYPGTNRLEAVGDEGKIVLENGVLKVWKLNFSESEYRVSASNGTCTEKPEYTEYTFENSSSEHVNVLRAFADNILEGKPLVANGREGINELEITNAAYLSAWTDKTVALPIDREAFDKLLDEKKKASKYKKENDDETLPDGAMSTRWQIKW
ncbi:MAG: Gfo/Idh/MocA family oxidoreductase [Ruminococcaceae bacterium]|nr:Gfo/Idh/MocA family oxidoreductase [Oscillospiraceae bacterium]